mmetsp:Transcript_3983/g.9323  ORF Transcript_3983/g.9323 Transcript_3983/m.9323 type:complete len:385 (-) Transcript_3983:718-1872(-)
MPEAKGVQGHAVCPLLLPLPHLWPHQVRFPGVVEKVPLQRRRLDDLRAGAQELPEQRRELGHRGAVARLALHLWRDHVWRPHHRLLGQACQQHLLGCLGDARASDGCQPCPWFQVTGFIKVGVLALCEVHRRPLPARGAADVWAPPQCGDRLPDEPGHRHLQDYRGDLWRRWRRRGRGDLCCAAHHHELHVAAAVKSGHDRHPCPHQARGLHSVHHCVAAGGGPHERAAEPTPYLDDRARAGDQWRLEHHREDGGAGREPPVQQGERSLGRESIPVAQGALSVVCRLVVARGAGRRVDARAAVAEVYPAQLLVQLHVLPDLQHAGRGAEQQPTFGLHDEPLPLLQRAGPCRDQRPACQRCERPWPLLGGCRLGGRQGRGRGLHR